mmetsp:Transcript_5652/g.14385  ORF Transcript_5652/g.14385 Transcript_5652/m.14385 type:complete len:213 (-) Transcript_5652:8-646(-)
MLRRQRAHLVRRPGRHEGPHTDHQRVLEGVLYDRLPPGLPRGPEAHRAGRHEVAVADHLLRRQHGAVRGHRGAEEPPVVRRRQGGGAAGEARQGVGAPGPDPAGDVPEAGRRVLPLPGHLRLFWPRDAQGGGDPGRHEVLPLPAGGLPRGPGAGRGLRRAEVHPPLLRGDHGEHHGRHQQAGRVPAVAAARQVSRRAYFKRGPRWNLVGAVS